LAFVTVILNTFGTLNEAVLNAHGRKCQEIMHRFNSNSGVFESKILGVNKTVDGAAEHCWPIEVSCYDNSAWKSKVFPLLADAWGRLQNPLQTIPTICSRLLTLIRDMPATEIVQASELYGFLRQFPDFAHLNDGALEALMGYAEMLGEVLLVREPLENEANRQLKANRAVAIVIRDPNWFCSRVLGKLFDKTFNSTHVPMVQTCSTICAYLRTLEGFSSINDHILEQIPSLLEEMGLCCRTEEIH
jgi:hypothetical protein